MTEAGSAPRSEVDVGTWPVQCPVDQRWILQGDTCPDCGSSVAPIQALNELAAALLETASRSSDPVTSAALVSEAASLVPSTERFHEAAADALVAAGRPDLALQQINAALAIAPRRGDLQTRAAALAKQPVTDRSRRDRAARWGVLAAAAVVLIGVGAVGGGLVGRSVTQAGGAGSTPAPSSVAIASPSATPAAPSVSTAPTPGASPAPSESAPPSASPDPSRLVRAVLAAASIPGSDRLAVELIGDTVRISGPVADAEARSHLKAAVGRALPGVKVDLDGVTFPRSRYVYVQRGDTLWSIAARMYGDPRLWRAIAAANPGLDPSSIHAGQRLRVP